MTLFIKGQVKSGWVITHPAHQATTLLKTEELKLKKSDTRTSSVFGFPKGKMPSMN